MANSYEIIKNTKGGLTLTIPSYDSSVGDRVFDIPYNQKSVRVPRVYALGIFVNPTLQRMYEQGYFSVEPRKEFEADVAELNASTERPVKVVDDSTIVEALKRGNRVKIKEIMSQGVVNKDKVIILARENIGDISMSMIEFLEKLLGVELKVDGE